MNEEKLDRIINFRATEKMYKDLMRYLKQTGDTISAFMRQATYDYLKLKKAFEENGFKIKEEKKKQEKINAPPPEIMYCDSDKCEIDPHKSEKC